VCVCVCVCARMCACAFALVLSQLSLRGRQSARRVTDDNDNGVSGISHLQRLSRHVLVSVTLRCGILERR
jgi:hypothetical protein